MNIKTRVRPENESQKCYILRFQSAFGATKITTFLTEKEVARYEKAGISCEKVEV